MTTELFVKFEDKEFAKEAGARWNPTLKKWTIQNMTAEEFFMKMTRIKENGLSDYFEIVLHEDRCENAYSLGAEDSIMSRFSERSMYRQLFVSGMRKSEFWKKLKELEAIDKKKYDDKWNKRQDEWNIQEILEYEQQQQIDNEQNQLIESDMMFLILTMSDKMTNP